MLEPTYSEDGHDSKMWHVSKCNHVIGHETISLIPLLIKPKELRKKLSCTNEEDGSLLWLHRMRPLDPF